MKPAEGAADISLHREIPSRLGEVDGVCREIRSLLTGRGLEGACFSAQLLAREGLTNAIVHGHQRDETKKIEFDLRVGRKWISLQILDQGPGFNWRKARRAPPPKDTAPSGRGLCISALYAQRITFNRRGNRITLWLKK
jgi:serine/threonine-protein kinase RsbW